MELTPINVRDAAEIERAVTAFVRSGDGGLILTTSALVLAHRDLIITLADRHKLPAVYYRAFTLPMAAWSPMVLIMSTNTAALPSMSTASSRGRSPPTFLCKRRPSTSW